MPEQIASDAHLNAQQAINPQRRLYMQLVVIETLIQVVNRTIELLQERRSALISAAVTGKIDVRSDAAC